MYSFYFDRQRVPWVGALAIVEVMPHKYKHMLGGPSLKVDAYGSHCRRGVDFPNYLCCSCDILKGPRSNIVKTWLLAMATVVLVVAGGAYTGPSMNPANAFGWAYLNKWHDTWDQFYVYWICPFVGAILAAGFSVLSFRHQHHQQRNRRKIRTLPPSPSPPPPPPPTARSVTDPPPPPSFSRPVPSSADSSDQLLPDKMNKRPSKHESLSDKIHRFRSVLLVVSIPLLLIVFVLFLMPGRSSSSDPVSLTNRRVWPNQKLQKSYAVIFDAGSSGSRVHVYCFDQNLDLVPIGKDLELFVQVFIQLPFQFDIFFLFEFTMNVVCEDGLSAYASDPQQAAESLVSLLDKAQGVVPHDLRPKTPVRVGATAGLRALGHDVSERILQAVRDLLKYRSTFKTEQNGVTVLDGIQEGAYEWVTINYLLGNLGKKYSNTVGVVDLGGGSVQMAYAISEEDAAKAPEVPEGEDSYVKEMLLMGTKYYLYVHSYLHYGLLAARAEMLMVTEDSDNPCILAGYDGSYNYGGKDHKASAPSSGSNLDQCVSVALKALKVNDTCSHMQCTFGGIWNGGRGDGQKHLFVASFFFDRAAEARFIDPQKPVAKVSPADFEIAAKRACQTKIEDAKSAYPNVDDSNLPYICMDLVYQHTLLVVGFGLEQEITLVKQVEYQNSLVEAAWPLGSAIEAVSST
ncbi:hypothetical protein LWI29_016336 [Acer saccharum]|uniref:apyrase n=1 Tax=Acer saccharum TaxID=4024 RepID=A0AA39W1A7_ACESA|nr:hypothetical protein LWI29_016336 [Acer saccharum]